MRRINIAERVECQGYLPEGLSANPVNFVYTVWAKIHKYLRLFNNFSLPQNSTNAFLMLGEIAVLKQLPDNMCSFAEFMAAAWFWRSAGRIDRAVNYDKLSAIPNRFRGSPSTSYGFHRKQRGIKTCIAKI